MAASTDKATKTYELVGRVHSWQYDDEHKPRHFMFVQVPFSFLLNFVDVSIYNDTTGKGVQREEITGHVNSLEKDIRNGDYTPTPFAAHARPVHMVKNRTENPDGTTTVIVASNAKLTSSDGGQRGRALRRLLLKAGDAAQKERIENLPIGLTVYLEPDRHVQDFINMQKGKNMDRAHLKSLLHRHGKDKDNKNYPLIETCRQVLHGLNEDQSSYLNREVRFDTLDSGHLRWDALSATGSSELATSFFGGAIIAKNFGKDADWLTAVYMDAWHAVQKYTELDAEDGKEISACLMREKLLRPIGVMRGGYKGGSIMLTGIGNMLAWRLCKAGKDKAHKDDLVQLAEAIDATLNIQVYGSFAGGVKREKMGEFAAAYLGDLDTEMFEGIPSELLKLLSYSSFALTDPKKNKGELPEPAQDEEEEDLGVPFDVVEEGRVKVQKGQAKNLQKIGQQV